MVRSFTLGPDRTKISPVRSSPSPTVRSGQSTRKGRFEVIKNTISCSLQAVGVNLGISFLVEAYAYYQFVYLALRIITYSEMRPESLTIF